MTSHQDLGFIPLATSHALNPPHSLLSCIILLACLTSKPLFPKHYFMVSIHLFFGLPTERISAHSPSYSLSNPNLLHPLYMVGPPENTFINLHNSLICAFGTLSILLILCKPRLSICTLSHCRMYEYVQAMFHAKL